MGHDAKKTELTPGTLEMLILKTIERNAGPMRGYGIARYIKQISGDVLQVEEGSLYPALQRLAIKGWVKAEWGQSENNRRARLYKLTPAGRKQLKQEVADFERVLEVGDLLLQLLPPGGRQLVEAGAPVVLRLTPLRFDPAFDRQALQRGVERTFLDLQHVVGSLLDVAGDSVAVHRPRVTLDGLEDEHLQRSRNQLSFLCIASHRLSSHR